MPRPRIHSARPSPGPHAPDPAPARPAPLFLLADSQLLFRPAGGVPLAERIAAHLPAPAPRAAFLGASGGDDPDHYALFLAAMEPLRPAGCRPVTASPSPEALAFLREAEVIVVGGGDVERGWRAFQASGVREAVAERRAGGAVLVGVSAGAVQLGLAGWPEGTPGAPFPTWGFAPFVVDAHAEADGWRALREVVGAGGAYARGVGVPSGGGAVAHPDGRLEALGRPLFHLRAGRDGS